MVMEDEILKSEAREKAISEAIRGLWRPDAEAIINLIKSGNECIAVAAPSGSGKSIDLAPMLVTVGWERSFHPFSYDCQRLPSNKTTEIIDTFERITQIKRERGIAILDEPLMSDDAMANVLELLYGHGHVGVVGLFRVQREKHKLNVKRWIEAGRKKGKSCSVYEMRPKTLPLGLARDFLEVFKHKNPGIIGYITDNFPLYPRVLDRLGGAEDEKEVIELWQDMVNRIDAGWGFTEEEASLVNSNLKI